MLPLAWILVSCSLVLPAAPFVVPATVVDEQLEELERRLQSERPETRRSAVRALARHAGRDAWELVLAALEDPSSMVGDAAQVALASIDDEHSLAELMGRAGLRSKSVLVRTRAAEAIGRVGIDVDAMELVARATGETEVERRVLWSLERLARAGRLTGNLERAFGAVKRKADAARDRGVRASAVVALLALSQAPGADDDLNEQLLRSVERARRARDPRVRCAAMIAAGGLDPVLGLSTLRPGSSDPAWSVRMAAVDGLERTRSRSSAVALVSALERETHPAVSECLVRSLRRLSGLKYRSDPRPWRDWADALESDWRPGLRLGGATGRREGGAAPRRTAASLAGLPVTSLRVNFLIDFSGSMWMPMSDGSIPKEHVDVAMREVLEGLPREAMFNVTPFARDPEPWSERLVPARPKRVKRAIEDFERCALRGTGNFFDAAILALEDPDVDTIVTLTDGVPTGGTHSDMDLILALLLERNRFRRVRFDAVLVDAPGGARRRWEELARASGGKAVAVDRL